MSVDDNEKLVDDGLNGFDRLAKTTVLDHGDMP